MSYTANSDISTQLLHADAPFEEAPVAAPISVSTTFRYPDGPFEPDNLDLHRPERHVYSRYTQPSTTRVEAILGEIHNGHAVAYSSGLSAGFAALIFLKPKRIAIRNGYHGFHRTIQIYQKINPSVTLIDLDDEYQAGDVVWLESPLNPTAEVRDIAHYAKRIHAVGGKLGIDATFAPPPLQYPFKWGADLILHSATKYFGGHSDLLAGVLVVKTEEEWKELWTDRTYLGNNIGSLDSWLLLRSLRTFSLRITAQSKNATELAQWLYELSKIPEGQEYDGVKGGIVTKVYHGLYQEVTTDFDPKAQHEGGWSPTFSILIKDPKTAEAVPGKLKLFVHATSLGGVESLIELRKRSDPAADPRLLRISVGVEAVQDLKDDFRRAFKAVESL